MNKPNKLIATLAVAFLSITGTNYLNAQIISTFAGTGTMSFSGDGGAATAAACSLPNDVAFDASGNVYIVDVGNNRIRKVTPAGIITTIAGSGTASVWSGSFTGDGGPATAATFFQPSGIAIDAGGNIFVADCWSNRIRKIDVSGTVTTIAGSGAVGWSTGGYGGDGGPATAARLNAPMTVAIDNSGNIFIADGWNHRIRKVSTSGIITTVAGTGTYGFSGDGGPATAAKLDQPNAILPDASGNLYIADYGNNLIRKVSSSGIITTFAGIVPGGFAGDGGPATAAKFNHPSGLAFDAVGNLLIADSHNNRIRKISMSTGIINTIAGTGTYGYSGDGGPAVAADIKSAVSVKVKGTDIYISDSNSNVVRKISYTSTATPEADLITKNKISVFPNPTSGTIELNVISATKGIAAISITNSTGEVVKNLNIPVTIGANSMSNLQLNVPPGIYFITSKIGNELNTSKIIVE